MTCNPLCPHILINRKSIHEVALKDKTNVTESAKVCDLTLYDKFSYEDIKQALEQYMKETNFAPSTVTGFTCIVTEFVTLRKLNKIAVNL